MRVSRVIAKNFRCLRDVDLKLREFNVVVGPNGAGKSSLLQLLHSFVESARGHLGDFFSRLGGFHTARSLFAESESVNLNLALTEEKKGNSWQYRLNLLGQGGGAYIVQEEEFDFKEKRSDAVSVIEERFVRQGLSISFQRHEKPALKLASHSVSTSEAALLELSTRLPEVRRFIDSLEHIALWRGCVFQPIERVRSPQQLRPTTSPGFDGSDLYSALYYLQTKNKTAFRELLEILQLAIPQLEEIGFPPAGAGHIYMSWKQRDFEKELDAVQLSDGTLRLLWLLTILFTAPDDGLIMIDEPELSLHPQWIQLLVSVLRKTSARTSVLIATQSAELLRWIEPNELLIADAGEAGTKFSWADEHPNLGKWLEDFTLSELWTMGQLGGRR
ncbi:MAG: AAA family ATPase [Planctomycetes bacterium]|nr:AAA family ATPase [Planctomycetota bacterium]MBI3834295.1 AAA family ATPase [Planctomycetota bacterium]